MEAIARLYRYMSCAIYYYTLRPEPNFRVVEATINEVDVTPQVISHMATSSVNTGIALPFKRKDGQLLKVKYTAKTGDSYITYFEAREVIQIQDPENADPINVDNVIVSADVGDEDITDLIKMYAGPDGTFHGRFDNDTKEFTSFNVKVLGLKNYDKEKTPINILFASGKEINL